MMSSKPIFVATHPRACSTAFERVFMTRRDMTCAHEPFGDAYYYGPERLHDRYEAEDKRLSSGFSKTTYQDVLNRLDEDGSDGKRVFIKDMAYYLMSPDGKPTTLAPSVCSNQANGQANGEVSNGIKKGVGTTEPGNPTVLPLDVLKKYHFTFLIRHPRRGIPSFFRCTIPPLDEVTGWGKFNANEAGYVELRTMFDYLRAQGLVGPHMAEAAEDPAKSQANGTNGHANGHSNGHKPDEVTITVIDADDLLDHPKEIIEAFCKETGVPFTPDMLNWDDPENQQHVEEAFAKWNGWHNDAIKSKNLSPRTHAHKSVSEETEDEQWREKYGEEGAKEIRACVNENVPHYEYLKQFAIKVENLGV
ncbi:P-loop containing nucleoside triphosphate hydrolase protein [Truncatella angustata]|uniref:P-loop containing nucleoside triphosphate hydrolase protein n=1 Tax=Truncatella angustata TaxID=152316 RepID=A0A9P8UKH9_9PEZI|nr:P-loop containing nucleoside triphosphate hydrolase protein [Truncatella angustata]KAH6654190.1 P-loop containing nucleoside triphosphate hydrolase protein [Truncatella angustata]